MSTGIWAAASGATSQLLSLDATANNLANAQTPGYKADHAVFREHLMSAAQGGRAVSSLKFAAVDGFSHDMAGGSIQATGRPLDVAIDGDGFFAVSTPNGERYTRAGTFDLNDKSQLVGIGGMQVLGENGRPLSVPSGAKSVRLTKDGSLEADGAVVGRLKLVKFQGPSALDKEGHLLFKPNAGSGPARVAPVKLETEAVEGANVSVVTGMASIVTTTRTFDAMERVIDAFKDADRRAAMDLGRVK